MLTWLRPPGVADLQECSREGLEGQRGYNHQGRQTNDVVPIVPRAKPYDEVTTKPGLNTDTSMIEKQAHALCPSVIEEQTFVCRRIATDKIHIGLRKQNNSVSSIYFIIITISENSPAFS